MVDILIFGILICYTHEMNQSYINTGVEINNARLTINKKVDKTRGNEYLISNSHALFIYGTLMPYQRNHLFIGSPFIICPALIKGYSLWHLQPEDYPAMIHTDCEDIVRGYIVLYDEIEFLRRLPILDKLEGTEEKPPLYRREKIDFKELVISCESSIQYEKPIDTWIYIYNRTERLQKEGAFRVKSGDWTRMKDEEK